tara:strand:- start:2 stop:436 length:435 start_codon:yes stop_codon:yes gene_type:complete
MDNIINNNDMDKEQLETNLAALKLLQQETNEKLTDYKVQVSLIEKELEDINKPELTPAQMDNVYLAVERAVEEFDFSDTGNFDIDYTLDYDSRIQCETHDFCNSTDLVELICNEVTKLFKEAKCPTDEKNARDDKEAEKLADNS